MLARSRVPALVTASRGPDASTKIVPDAGGVRRGQKLSVVKRNVSR